MMEINLVNNKGQPIIRPTVGDVYRNSEGGLLVCYSIKEGSIKVFEINKSLDEIVGITSYCLRYVTQAPWTLVGKANIPKLTLELF